MARSLLLLVVMLLGPARSVLAEEVKLGYVDLQRALLETEDGRKAKANLKKIFDQKQKELDEQQEELKKAADDLEKKRTLLPANTVKEKEAELQRNLQKVQQTYVRHQQDIAAKEQEATQAIFQRMQRIIGKIAAAESFTMVFDKNQSAVLFAKPHLDLTNELIRRYNSGEGGDPNAPPAGGQKAAAGGGGGKAKK